MARETLIDRVRKLLAKAEDAGISREEASSYFAMASKLITQHNIAEGDLAEKGKWIQETALVYGRLLMEHQAALHICRNYFFVAAYTMDGEIPGKRSKELVFFGTEENVATARFIFNSLLRAFDRLWLEYQKETKSPAKDRRIYISGIAEGFIEQLKEQREKDKSEFDELEASKTELAIFNINKQTEDALQEAFDKSGGKTKDIALKHSDVVGSSSAYEEGRRKGKSLKLNKEIEQKEKKMLEN